MEFTRKLRPHHLRLIVKIADSAKLLFAAEAMGMSQPAASRTLADIEAEIGFPLFVRSPKGMYPTPVGETFLRHARAVLTGLDTMEFEVEGLMSGTQGEVRVGAVTGPAIRCLVPSILEIKQVTPLVETTVEVATSADLIRNLERGRFDFVIARLPATYDSRAFDILPARPEFVSLLVRSAHPLVGKPQVTLHDLAECDWAVQERGYPIRVALEEAFLAEGIRLPPNITNTSSLLVMLGLVEQSNTVATVVEEVATVLTSPKLGANLHILALDRTITVSPYFVIMRRGSQLSSAAQRLLDAVLARV